MTEHKKLSETRYSIKVHASYALGSLFNDFIGTALGIMVFKFYETEIFLPIIYIELKLPAKFSVDSRFNPLNPPCQGDFIPV